MRRVLLLLGLMVFMGAPAFAQLVYPKGEFYLGYSYANLDALNIIKRQHGHGWGSSIAGNVHRHIGFVLDVGGHYGNLDVAGIGADFRVHEALFGPRFTARGENASGFFHTLFGVVHHDSTGALATSGLPLARSETDFAMGIGGGVDYNVSKRVAVRVFQVDWIPVRSSVNFTHHFRVQGGVVFKFAHGR